MMDKRHHQVNDVPSFLPFPVSYCVSVFTISFGILENSFFFSEMFRFINPVSVSEMLSSFLKCNVVFSYLFNC